MKVARDQPTDPFGTRAGTSARKTGDGQSCKIVKLAVMALAATSPLAATAAKDLAEGQGRLAWLPPSHPLASSISSHDSYEAQRKQVAFYPSQHVPLADDESDREGLLHGLPRRRPLGSNDACHWPNSCELVIARHHEDIAWVARVPRYWRVTVYDSGTGDLPWWPHRPYDLVKLQNQVFGREGYVYATHLAKRYHTLADYTVFSQDAPAPHAPHLLDMLRRPAMLQPVQTLSTKYSELIPPTSVRSSIEGRSPYRSDIFSLYSMESVYFTDCCIHGAASGYREKYSLTANTNIIAHMFQSIGLPFWIPEQQEVGTFAFAGIFGVAKDNVLQHPRTVYRTLQDWVIEHIQNGYLLERSWLMMFGGAEFVDASSQPLTKSNHRSTSQVLSSPNLPSQLPDTAIKPIPLRKPGATSVSRELVVARGDGDDTSWLDAVPLAWNITLYARDVLPGAALLRRPHKVVELPLGGEAYAFAYHVKENYASLADYTAFAHGDALIHNPQYLALLAEPETLNPVQVMSLRQDHNRPPQAFIDALAPWQLSRPERISTRTLDALTYQDFEHGIASAPYRRYYNLPEGTNLIAHFLNSVGLPDAMPQWQNTATYAHAMMLGLDKHNIQNSPLSTWQMLAYQSLHVPAADRLAEKAFLMMFGSPAVAQRGHRRSASGLAG